MIDWEVQDYSPDEIATLTAAWNERLYSTSAIDYTETHEDDCNEHKTPNLWHPAELE